VAINTKRKGNRNEYKSRKFLEKDGYICTRAAASLGEWDLIGLRNESVVLVQVKSNKWPSSKEMEVLNSFFDIVCPRCGHIIGKRILHRWDDYSRVPKIKILGEENGKNI
jgi:hypothetical protein